MDSTHLSADSSGFLSFPVASSVGLEGFALISSPNDFLLITHCTGEGPQGRAELVGVGRAALCYLWSLTGFGEQEACCGLWFDTCYQITGVPGYS